MKKKEAKADAEATKVKKETKKEVDNFFKELQNFDDEAKKTTKDNQKLVSHDNK